MKIDIRPNLDQIRWFAKAALHAWDVTPERARESVAADMTALLAYLDACDNSSGRVVLGVAKIERGIRLKINWTDQQAVDLTDQYADDRDTPECSGDRQRTVLGDIQDVRAHIDERAVDRELDLATLGDGRSQ